MVDFFNTKAIWILVGLMDVLLISLSCKKFRFAKFMLVLILIFLFYAHLIGIGILI